MRRNRIVLIAAILLMGVAIGCIPPRITPQAFSDASSDAAGDDAGLDAAVDTKSTDDTLGQVDLALDQDTSSQLDTKSEDTLADLADLDSPVDAKQLDVADVESGDLSPDAAPIDTDVAEPDTEILEDLAQADQQQDVLSGPVTLAELGNSGVTFRLTPDGQRVVFTGQRDKSGAIRLHSVPTEGGTVATLSHNTGSVKELAVTAFEVTSDSSTVVFMGDTEVDSVVRLYAVGVDGGPITTLSQNTGPDTSLAVADFKLAPAGKRAVFLAAMQPDGYVRLYSVALSGGTVLTLSRPNPGDPDVIVSYDAKGNTADYNRYFAITPDGSTVVFTGWESGGPTELRSISIGGLSPAILSSSSGNAKYWVGEFLLAPATNRVVFGSCIGHFPATSCELHSVNVLAGPSTYLADGYYDEQPDFEHFMVFALPPSGQRVVFQPEELGYRLHSVPMLGGATVVISHSVTVGSVASDSQIDPTSTYVVFRSDAEPGQVMRLYSNLLTGGAPTLLSQNIGSDKALKINSFQISSDGKRVVFLGNPELDGVTRLYAVDITGTNLVRLSENAGTDKSIAPLEFAIAPNGKTVVFRARTETNGPVRLYAVPIGGGIVPRLSHDTTDANAFVSTFAISPDSTRVVFLGPLESDGVWRIYSNQIPAN